jgi:hypothetical protein
MLEQGLVISLTSTTGRNTSTISKISLQPVFTSTIRTSGKSIVSHLAKREPMEEGSECPLPISNSPLVPARGTR